MSIVTATREFLLMQLACDEGWQTNLTQVERAYCIEWAARFCGQAVAQAYTEAKAKLRMINQIMDKSQLDREDIIRVALNEEVNL